MTLSDQGIACLNMSHIHYSVVTVTDGLPCCEFLPVNDFLNL